MQEMETFSGLLRNATVYRAHRWCDIVAATATRQNCARLPDGYVCIGTGTQAAAGNRAPR
jgi:hypothetical protein